MSFLKEAGERSIHYKELGSPYYIRHLFYERELFHDIESVENRFHISRICRLFVDSFPP